MPGSEPLKAAALVVVSLVVTLGALESGVRLLVDLEAQQPIGVYDVDWDNPLRYIPGAQHTYTSSEFSFTVKFNRYGRRDIEWSAETIADPRSILLIGDSFVLGNSVEAPDTMPARMEGRLAERGDPREVLNFGMPGGAPPNYARLLESAIDEGFRARTVVVSIFVGNDFYPEVLQPSQRPPRAPASPTPSRLPASALVAWLKSRVAQSARLMGLVFTAGQWLGLSFYDTAGSYIFLRKQTPEQAALFERILDEIGRMNDLAASDGRRLYAVVIPNRLQVENGDELTGAIYDASAPHQRILAWCKARGIRCLDLLPALVAADREGGPLYYPIDRHFNPRGYAFAADRIVDFLAAQGAVTSIAPEQAPGASADRSPPRLARRAPASGPCPRVPDIELAGVSVFPPANSRSAGAMPPSGRQEPASKRLSRDCRSPDPPGCCRRS
jgi:hypothetical protein